jgi:hypothetical protein
VKWHFSSGSLPLYVAAGLIASSMEGGLSRNDEVAFLRKMLHIEHARRRKSSFHVRGGRARARHAMRDDRGRFMTQTLK